MCNSDMQKRVEHSTAETVESLKIAGEGQLPPPSPVPPFQMGRDRINCSKSSKTKSK